MRTMRPFTVKTFFFGELLQSFWFLLTNLRGRKSHCRFTVVVTVHSMHMTFQHEEIRKITPEEKETRKDRGCEDSIRLNRSLESRPKNAVGG